MNSETDVFDVRNFIGQWDYSTLPANLRLGQDCYLEGRDSFSRFRSERDPGLVIGNRVKVYSWSALSVDPTGYLEIGDDCVLVGAIFWCAHSITVGKRVRISYNVMIADSDFHPKDPDLRRLDAIAIAPFSEKTARPEVVGRPVVIEDDVTIGMGVTILKGVRIGAGAKVLPGAVVARNVEAGATVGGNPAKVVEPEDMA